MFKPEVIPFVPKLHYPEISAWWLGHNWPQIPEKFLPSVGFMIPGVVVGFIYSTDSDIALLEWVVSNPNASPIAVARGLPLIIEELKKSALENGYTAIFSFIKNEGLQKIYEKSGFKVTDTGMTHVLFTEGN